MVAFRMPRSVFESTRVFDTGHSGFKGAWLTRWLLASGAEVAGYSLPPRYEPYRCSKAMCELAAASFRDSFFTDHRIKMATSRAGKVIGGGDWAIDRIVTDCMRAWRLGEPITVRNPALQIDLAA